MPRTKQAPTVPDCQEQKDAADAALREVKELNQRIAAPAFQTFGPTVQQAMLDARTLAQQWFNLRLKWYEDCMGVAPHYTLYQPSVGVPPGYGGGKRRSTRRNRKGTRRNRKI